MASVFIERMTVSSSATVPRCGKISESSVPLCPQRLKANCGAKHFNVCSCNCASCCPAVNDSGIGCPWSFASCGLGSNVSKCDGPPAM